MANLSSAVCPAALLLAGVHTVQSLVPIGSVTPQSSLRLTGSAGHVLELGDLPDGRFGIRIMGRDGIERATLQCETLGESLLNPSLTLNHSNGEPAWTVHSLDYGSHGMHASMVLARPDGSHVIYLGSGLSSFEWGGEFKLLSPPPGREPVLHATAGEFGDTPSLRMRWPAREATSPLSNERDDLGVIRVGGREGPLIELERGGESWQIPDGR